jgi:hypothetical protein
MKEFVRISLSAPRVTSCDDLVMTREFSVGGLASLRIDPLLRCGYQYA